MAHPAKEARDRVIASFPDAVVVERRRNSIKHAIPSIPNKFILDLGIGPMHFGPSEDQEINTAWQPGIAPWDFQMTQAGFSAFALSNFSSGQIVKYVHPGSGESIAFQPQQLQYTNDLDQIQAIANPQSVGAVVQDEDVLFWQGAFGPGFDIRWQAQTARLDKRLVVDQASRWPTPTAQIIAGGNPVARLQFIFQVSTGIDIFVNGVLWTRQPNSTRDTQAYVEFRLQGTGEVLWSFNLPRSNASPVEDQDPDELLGTFRLRRTGPNLFVEHRIPIAWLQAADYPIEIDVTIDEVVGASADDASQTTADVVSILATSITVDNTQEHAGFRWTTVGVPVAATINSAWMSIFIVGTTTDEPQHQLRGQLVADAAEFTTGSNNIDARSRTTATVNWEDTDLGSGADEEWQWGAPNGSPTSGADIKTIIQEIVDQGGWAQNNAMVLIFEQHTLDSARDLAPNFYDASTSLAAKLHIEYTSSGPQTITCTGIASTEAFGTAQLNLQVLPSAISSTEAFGTSLFILYLLPTGIASSESFGTAVLSVGAVDVAPSGIATSESFGTATLTLYLLPSAIASAEAFGTALFVLYVVPSGIASGESFGTTTVTPGAVTVGPTGVASAETFGTAALALYLVPSGIASSESFGTAQLNLVLFPSGIASAESFGTAALVLYILPSGIASAESFGTATVTVGALVLFPDGIATSEAFGTTTLTPGAVTLSPTGIASAEAFGTSTLSLYLLPSSITSGESFGTAQLNLVLLVSGIASAEAFGTAQLNLTISASGIASSEAFGNATVSAGLLLLPDAIGSSESFGTTTLVPGAVDISPTGIASTESFGTATLGLYALPDGITTTELFGTALLGLYLLPTAISTEELFGTADVSTTGAQTIEPSSLLSEEVFGTALLEVEVLRVGARPQIFPVGPPVVVVDRAFPEEIRQRAIDQEAKRLRQEIVQREQLVKERIDSIRSLLADAREDTEDANRKRNEANAELLKLEEERGQIALDRSSVYRMQNKRRLERAREQKKSIELNRRKKRRK